MDQAQRERVAAQVSAAMRAAGVTQRSLAEATGIPQVTLSRSLNAHRALDTDELGRIASALGVRASDLLRAAESAAA